MAPTSSNSPAKVVWCLFTSAVIGLLISMLVGFNVWSLSLAQALTIASLIAALVLSIAGGLVWAARAPNVSLQVVAQSRVVMGSAVGILVVLWGQVFIALGLVSAWRLIFPASPMAGGAPGVPALPSVGDVVQLIQALTVAPTWLGMTVLGTALSLAGAWIMRNAG